MRSSLAFAAWLIASAAGAHPCAKGKATRADVPLVLAGIVNRDGSSVGTVPARIADARLHAVGKRDRYGRLPVFALRDGSSEQERLLREGGALAMAVRLPPACRERLAAAETEARRAKKGLWRRSPVERAADRTLGDRVNRFALVEGRVVSVGDRERALYLNFGANWRDDFTVFLNRKDFRRHPEWLRILSAASGRTVRVRGWLEDRGGPFMRVRDVAQIEIAPVFEVAR